MHKILSIRAREILDSRGFPTVQADLAWEGGMASAAVPSGASTGSNEALELRDGDPARFLGKGVLKAVAHVNDVIAPAMVGQSLDSQLQLDQILRDLDGTEFKSTLGANAILAVSMAASRAIASIQQTPLYAFINTLTSSKMTMPVPMMNILNGGAHADNNVDIQEFMIVPHTAPSFREALRYGSEIFHTLKKILKKQGLNTAVGDEGGFAPNLKANQEAIDLILEAITQAGYTPGEHISLALDCASTEFYRDGQYHLAAEGSALSASTWSGMMAEWVQQYPIISIEDGMAEEDWAGWAELTSACGDQTQLVGDDLFVTNTRLLRRGIDDKVANSILIKLNQIGTVTETMEAIKMAQDAEYSAVVSHRSGETEDTFIADLAVGSGAGQIKTGSLCRSDRIAKYNTLLRIEEQLGDKARYAGLSAFSRTKASCVSP